MNKLMFAAEVAHEVNRVYSRALCDYTQVDWKYAEDSQKNVAISIVKTIMDNPDITPEESYNKFVEKKRLDGWKYAHEDLPDKKKGPYIVDFEDLPMEFRIREELFFKIVKAVLSIDFG